MNKVSLIVPVYNESLHLQKFLEAIDVLQLQIDKELVIIDDCSTDDSWEIINNFSFKTSVILYQQDKNRGKGAAIRKGIEHATGGIIGVQDADFEYETGDISRLIQPLIDKKADLVFGSRFKKSNPQVFRTFHYLINRILTIYSNLCSGLYLTDMETCYKVFRREVIDELTPKLQQERFGFEPEVTARIARRRHRIYEISVSYSGRTYAEGKKIGWKDGFQALWCIVRYGIKE